MIDIFRKTFICERNFHKKSIISKCNITEGRYYRISGNTCIDTIQIQTINGYNEIHKIRYMLVNDYVAEATDYKLNIYETLHYNKSNGLECVHIYNLENDKLILSMNFNITDDVKITTLTYAYGRIYCVNNDQLLFKILPTGKKIDYHYTSNPDGTTFLSCIESDGSKFFYNDKMELVDMKINNPIRDIYQEIPSPINEELEVFKYIHE